MNSFMSWVGGKESAARRSTGKISNLTMNGISRFSAARAGCCSDKPPGMDFEVWNDYNGNLANLYRCVRDKPNKLKYKLRYVLNSREDFDRIASLHKNGISSRSFRDVEQSGEVLSAYPLQLCKRDLTALQVSPILFGRISR